MHTKEFLLNLPNKVNQILLEGLSSCFHFDIDGPEGGQITIMVEEGQLKSIEGLHGQPNCIIKSNSEDLKKVFKGELNPMMAILTGKLKISNQTEMFKFAKILGWM